MCAKKRRTSIDFSDQVGADLEKQKREQSSYGYIKLPKGIKIFKVEAGETANFDIIPYEVSMKNHPDRNEARSVAVEGNLWWKRPFKIHVNVGVNNEKVVCPTSVGKPCPICEYRGERAQQGASKDELTNLNAKKRVLYVVVPIGHTEFKEEPHIFNMSWHNFQKQLNRDVAIKEEYKKFPNLEGGYTLRVIFSSEKAPNGRPYPEAGRIDFETRDKDYPEEILDEVPSLDEVLEIKSYDELFALLQGADVADENDEPEGQIEYEENPYETDEPPRRRRQKTVGYKSQEPKEEPDEASQEQKEEEPKKSSRRRRTRRDEPENQAEKEEVGQCPHGYTFGKDWDMKKECEDCEVWGDCRDEYDAKWDK